MTLLLIFRRRTPASASRQGSLFTHAPDLAFPLGAAYALLILANIIYNIFGADTVGAQFSFFVAPSGAFPRNPLGQKSRAFASTCCRDDYGLARRLFHVSSSAPDITLATITGMAFALLVNLSGGNLLSMYAP